jgi:hypothetical protein
MPPEGQNSDAVDSGEDFDELLAAVRGEAD